MQPLHGYAILSIWLRCCGFQSGNVLIPRGFACAWSRSTFLEEVGESLVPAPVAADGVAAEMVVEHPLAAQGTDGQQAPAEEQPAGTREAQILMETEAAQERRDVAPPSLELSTGKMNPRAPGWNKRLVH